MAPPGNRVVAIDKFCFGSLFRAHQVMFLCYTLKNLAVEITLSVEIH